MLLTWHFFTLRFHCFISIHWNQEILHRSYAILLQMHYICSQPNPVFSWKIMGLSIWTCPTFWTIFFCLCSLLLHHFGLYNIWLDKYSGIAASFSLHVHLAITTSKLIEFLGITYMVKYHICGGTSKLRIVLSECYYTLGAILATQHKIWTQWICSILLTVMSATFLCHIELKWCLIFLRNQMIM